LGLFVGDGATLNRPLIRRRDDHLIGHTPVRTQLSWCRDAGIRRAIVTHCGSEIVKGNTAEVEARVKEMAKERGVEATIAHDEMMLVLC